MCVILLSRHNEMHYNILGMMHHVKQCLLSFLVIGEARARVLAPAKEPCMLLPISKLVILYNKCIPFLHSSTPLSPNTNLGTNGEPF